jgi:hypothetical protein
MMEMRRTTATEKMIMHGAAAGKLRAYVRDNGEIGLRGLLRLADRLSATIKELCEREDDNPARSRSWNGALPDDVLGDARQGIAGGLEEGGSPLWGTRTQGVTGDRITPIAGHALKLGGGPAERAFD